MDKVRVLHADDSVVIRGIIRRYLSEDSDIVMLKQAQNGVEAVEYYKEEKPDIVIMDIEMPEMDGITALQKIVEHDPKAKVMMCSTLTQNNAEITLKAMRLGAIDYVAKPSNDSSAGSAEDFKQKLIHTLKAIVHPDTQTQEVAKPSAAQNLIFDDESKVTLRTKPPLTWKPKIFAVGSSTGGPNALIDLMKGLRTLNLKMPIVITQHMPATFTTLLAKNITAQSGVLCHEAQNGLVLTDGEAVLAQGGKHLEFEKKSNGDIVVKLGDGPSENFCKPAVDTMIRSLIPIYNDKIFTVILTGMGYDGQKSVEQQIKAGGYCVAQDKASSIVWGMPGAVASAGLCSALLPVTAMTQWIKDNVNTN